MDTSESEGAEKVTGPLQDSSLPTAPFHPLPSPTSSSSSSSESSRLRLMCPCVRLPPQAVFPCVGSRRLGFMRCGVASAYGLPAGLSILSEVESSGGTAVVAACPCIRFSFSFSSLSSTSSSSALAAVTTATHVSCRDGEMPPPLRPTGSPEPRSSSSSCMELSAAEGSEGGRK